MAQLQLRVGPYALSGIPLCFGKQPGLHSKLARDLALEPLPARDRAVLAVAMPHRVGTVCCVIRPREHLVLMESHFRLRRAYEILVFVRIERSVEAHEAVLVAVAVT